MATTSYEFNKNDSLIYLANLFNTDIKSIVRLNQWLKDEATGHTTMKPISKVSFENMKLSKLFVFSFSVTEDRKEVSKSFTIEANSEEYANEIFRTKFSKNLVPDSKLQIDEHGLVGKLTSIPRKNTISIGLPTKSENFRLIHDDGSGRLLQAGEQVGRINYDSGVILLFNSESSQFTKNIKLNNYYISVSFIHRYLIIPIIGNGNTSVEDYWETLDKTLGVSHKVKTENFISKFATQNVELSQTEESNFNVETVEFGKYTTNGTNYISGLGITSSNYNLNLSTVSFIEQYLVDFTSSLSSFVLVSDFASATMGAIVQTEIDQVFNQNEFEIKPKSLSDKDKNKFTHSYKIIGNASYAKCRVIIGNTVLNMPCFPESITDSTQVSYNSQSILGRSEPFNVYENSGPRTIPLEFAMHREMTGNVQDIEKIVRYIESAVYPQYGNSIAPIRVQVYIGKTAYISGIITSQNTRWHGPIGSDDKYNLVNISFTVEESTAEPKSASYVQSHGGYRT